MRTCHAMGGHRLLLMGMVWVWVQLERKMLGSGGYSIDIGSVGL